MIALDKIRLDGGTQPRAQLNLFTIDEYAEAMRTGAMFPPVIVFYDGADFWLADGYHRYHAAKQAGLVEIAADVRQGTQREAILYSVGANAAHGMRRTNEDKRRVVTMLLHDAEWSEWSDNEIARQCSVSQPFVSAIRAGLSYNGYKMMGRKVKRGNETYTMQTGNIGATLTANEQAELERCEKVIEAGLPEANRVLDAIERMSAKIPYYEIHELGQIFPMMQERELSYLANSIRRNGFNGNGMNHPITLYEGKILDGKCRYEACKIAGVMPTFDHFPEDHPHFRGDAFEFVMACNFHRANYSEGQLAVIAVRFERMKSEGVKC